MSSLTESNSLYQGLEHKSTLELLQGINAEDQKVALAVQACIPSIEKLVEAIFPKMQAGGRLFYIGAGTSGRLGIVDASEIPPTYGLPHGIVVGLIAGGDGAIRKAVEFAEDDWQGAERDLAPYQLSAMDSLVGIAASGRTPYVIGGVNFARSIGCVTGAICCNQGSALAQAAEISIEALVGPEFVTGSTRMKAGTAQKLILNMLSTSLMIKMGRVKGNKMVDMMLSNHKLVDRGRRMLMEELGIAEEEAAALLEKHGNVRSAIVAYKGEA